MRHTRKCREKLTVPLLCGLLMFVFRFASRHAVNPEMIRPLFEPNLNLPCSTFETLPRTIYVGTLEDTHIALVQK